MPQLGAAILMAMWVGSLAWGYDEPEGPLERFLVQIKGDLERLPDYVCSLSVERFARSSSEQAWEKIDTLHFETALVAGRELYGFPGQRRFQDRPLAELVGRGTVGTGQFALVAKHLFLSSIAQFTYRGENTQGRRTRYEYSFDVPPNRSSYKVRAGPAEATVGFQGSVWIDAETLDLTQLDVQAYDIDEKLGLSQVDTTVHYSRVNMDGRQVLLPLDSILAVVSAEGSENMNRTQLSACRRYSAESTIRFDTEIAAQSNGPPLTQGTASTPSGIVLPPGALIELTLDSDMNPAMTAIGDKVTATVARVLKDGERVSIPAGAVVRGRIVRLEKHTIPFPIYEIGLEFDTLESGGRAIPFTAMMVDAGPAAGLIHQAKRLDPKFTPHSKSQMDILVREFQRGQGILNWDARRGSILRGLRMKWRVESPAQ